MSPYEKMVKDLCKDPNAIIASLTPEKAHLWHMATGVATEAGELLDVVKKYCIYNKPLDSHNVIEELGDLKFYAEGTRQALNTILQAEVSDHDITIANMEKLLTSITARYRTGTYSDKQAQERSDKNE